MKQVQDCFLLNFIIIRYEDPFFPVAGGISFLLAVIIGAEFPSNYNNVIKVQNTRFTGS